MTKRIGGAAFVVCALLLGGCDPKNVKISSDPDRWGELESEIKELIESDQRLFEQYMARHVVGVAFNNGSAGIPADMTIGKAIEEQKKVRIVQDSMSSGAVVAGGSSLISRADIEREINNAIKVTIREPRIVPEDVGRRRFSDWFGMSVDVRNQSGKTISGIKGAVVFEDVFGGTVSQIDLQLNEEIRAKSNGTFTSYGKYLNRYNKSDIRLRDADFAKLRVKFVPEIIAFSDGTRLNISDISS